MKGKNGAVSRARETEIASLSPSKRRKVDSQLLSSPENFVAVSSESSTSPLKSSSFDGDLKESSKSLDLPTKAEGFGIDRSMFIDSASSRVSKVSEEPEEIESSETEKKITPTTEVNSDRKLSTTKMPSDEEIEEFFAAAEKYEQKRFAEKYNYDIEKDVPLEGRYEWIRLI